jgi:copper chaperone NosL
LKAPRAVVLSVAVAALGCMSRDVSPSAVDTRNDFCAFCRMPVSNARLAAQLAAPGDEARFFDDIGCLRGFLGQNQPLRRETAAFAADHRTGDWVLASAAVFSRCPGLETPMSSHLIAHADASSRDRDTVGGGCTPISVRDLFGPLGPPEGVRR